jgi:hypothetical protein
VGCTPENTRVLILAFCMLKPQSKRGL